MAGGDSSQKRMVLYIVAGLSVVAYLYFPSGESGGNNEPGLMDSVMGFFSFSSAGDEVSFSPPPSPEDMTPPRPPPPPESDVSEEEFEDFRAAFGGALVRVEAVPQLMAEPPWVAMEKIDTWYAVPETVEMKALHSYLSHNKLWVRLSALQFALSTDVLEPGVLRELKDQFIRQEHISQVHRFLKRAEALDPAVFYKMTEFLAL